MPVQYKSCKCGAKISRSLKRCDKCEAEAQKDYNTHRRDDESRRFYQSKEWKAVRLIVLQSNPFCVMCEKPATLVDHIIPIRSGGAKLDVSKLQGLCVACHNKKTALDG